MARATVEAAGTTISCEDHDDQITDEYVLAKSIVRAIRAFDASCKERTYPKGQSLATLIVEILQKEL